MKFSKDEGTITIATQETEKEVIVKVIDQVVGIYAKRIPYIFEPFHRVEDRGEKKASVWGWL
jgi:signal transduction histidine kinase